MYVYSYTFFNFSRSTRSPNMIKGLTCGTFRAHREKRQMYPDIRAIFFTNINTPIKTDGKMTFQYRQRYLCDFFNFFCSFPPPDRSILFHRFVPQQITPERDMKLDSLLANESAQCNNNRLISVCRRCNCYCSKLEPLFKY